MRHPVHNLTGFELLDRYTIRAIFEDGEEQTIDFEPVLAGDVYGPLRDPALFRRVRIDPEARTLVWPNGADFDPAILHDWPVYAPAMIELARRWEFPQR